MRCFTDIDHFADNAGSRSDGGEQCARPITATHVAVGQTASDDIDNNDDDRFDDDDDDDRWW